MNKKNPPISQLVFICPFQTNKAVWLGMELVVVDLWGGIGGLLSMKFSVPLFALREEHEPLWEVSPITPP